MLNMVLKRIHRELPNTIAITIHDSIMTGVLTDNVLAVKKIIEEELASFVGFRPQIEIERYNREKVENKEKETILRQYDATTLVSSW